jgi:tetratricopeptide (TPR) repeat protein
MTAKILSEAATAAKAGQLDVAADILRRAIARSPQNGRLHAELGRVLVLSNVRNEGGKVLLRAAQLSPDDWQIQAQVGRQLDRLREHKIAAQCYERALALHPGEVGLWCSLARMSRRDGNLERAEHAAGQALRLQPETADALHELGLLRWMQHRNEMALKLCAAAAQLEPGSVFYQCAMQSLEAELEAKERYARGSGTLRVGFHMNKPFHFSFLQPIFAALRADHAVRLTGEPALLADFNPQVVVVADVQSEGLRAMLPQSRFVYIRHGLISKNHLAKVAATSDYCANVTSEYVADMLVRTHRFSREKIWVTGYVPLDPLFRGAPLPLPFPLNRNLKTILFAPTWNRQLSAADLTRERTVDLLRGAHEDINVIVKPHPHTIRSSPDWFAAFQQAVKGRINAWLVEDAAADVTPCLAAADVLVSDSSSVALAYLALNRPMVLVNHPRREQDPGYNPDGLEWRWRDMAEEVTDIEDLPGAVARALADPEAHAAQRAHYRDLLFGTLTDGRAAERIAERIAQL